MVFENLLGYHKYLVLEKNTEGALKKLYLFESSHRKNFSIILPKKL